MTTRELRASKAMRPAQADRPGAAVGPASAGGQVDRDLTSRDGGMRPDPLGQKLLLSPAETCLILSIRKTTLYKWLGEGLLRSKKIGGKRLIQADSVRELSGACDEAAGI